MGRCWIGGAKNEYGFSYFFFFSCELSRRKKDILAALFAQFVSIFSIRSAIYIFYVVLENEVREKCGLCFVFLR